MDAIENTARREVSEEVGIEVGDIEYVCSNTFVADEGTQCLNVVTRGEYVAGEPRVYATDEVERAFWLPYEHFEGNENVPEYVVEFAKRVAATRAD
ncbi:NUDIX domain-containing protein [Halobacterium sp. KA-4]|uniref:NUDIX domain-containing protein n=1 Tax=Halobacterium sp. KA-4 TaxID=2896367 RepID=UPI001E505C3D|nr:NUDIX domain-containing protein [Halobacterium sp. KA-4]MCD2199963.1 NUDIX domain-containing protein [Halobacterium sp. KA-4]